MGWRMPALCEGCPFGTAPGQRAQRRALRLARWRAIKRDLLAGGVFWCHKTTREDDGDPYGETYTASGQEQYCAGALAFQERHGVSSNYARVCERLEWLEARRR